MSDGGYTLRGADQDGVDEHGRLRVSAAARVAGVSAQTIRNWMRAGMRHAAVQLPYGRLEYRVTREDLDRWVRDAAARLDTCGDHGGRRPGAGRPRGSRRGALRREKSQVAAPEASGSAGEGGDGGDGPDAPLLAEMRAARRQREEAESQRQDHEQGARSAALADLVRHGVMASQERLADAVGRGLISRADMDFLQMLGKAQQQQIVADRERGKLVDRAEAERAYTDAALALRQRLERLGSAVAVAALELLELTPEQQARLRRLVDDQVVLVLGEMAADPLGDRGVAAPTRSESDGPGEESAA
jgi:hypothetical protein